MTISHLAKLWYSATVEFLQGQLNDTERALRGLPPKQRASSRTLAKVAAAAKASAGKVTAAAKAPAGAAAAKRAPQRTAGGTSGSDSDEVTPSQLKKR